MNGTYGTAQNNHRNVMPALQQKLYNNRLSLFWCLVYIGTPQTKINK